MRSNPPSAPPGQGWPPCGPCRGSLGSARAPLRAFTLIELILVMAMLLTVLALAAPALAPFFLGRRLDGEAHRLLAATRYGQSRAVSEGIPMVLWLDVEAGRYGLQADPSYLTRDTNVLEFEWDERIEVNAEIAEFDTNRATWRPTGLFPERLRIMRFMPDGSIADTSPSRVLLRERDEDGVRRDDRSEESRTIWITQSPNRLRYEIPQEPPAPVRR